MAARERTLAMAMARPRNLALDEAGATESVFPRFLLPPLPTLMSFFLKMRLNREIEIKDLDHNIRSPQPIYNDLRSHAHLPARCHGNTCSMLHFAL